MELYNYTVSSLQRKIDLNLLFFGLEKCKPRHTWGPGLRDAYILHYIHAGRGLLRTKESTFELGAGQGFVIMPETLVHYSAHETEPWCYSWLGFTGMNARSLLQRAQIDAERPIFEVPAGSYLENFCEELKATYETRGSDVHSQSVLYRVLAELIRFSPETRDERKPAAASREGYIRKTIEFIESSYSQKISVLEIARFVGLDRTYLSGLFKERFGVSLQAFLLEYRMNRAVELLQNPELSVSDVSRSVGYTDPFLFSKMFKKTIGQAPALFREKSPLVSDRKDPDCSD
ncbi:AraC family transcriptional regulator [Paenibacillus sanguinis]|uniref:AraC family transcriptional regulator n=1 Tax=Paenibacillus sanguinis TaxID=225906 RepID=UPI00037616AC|nr:AraC family transcriptional regulator [Paenibacillus sanguinis]